jgi:hypothetical protein
VAQTQGHLPVDGIEELLAMVGQVLLVAVENVLHLLALLVAAILGHEIL